MTDVRNDRPTAEVAAAGGSTVEAILGAAAVVLAVLGLLDLLPILMMEIATIALGVALIFEGSALTAHFMRVRQQLGDQARTLIGGGVSAELIGGAAAVVLGVLSLLNVGAATTLIPVAAIVLGASLLLGGGATPEPRLEDRAHRDYAPPEAREGRAEVYQAPEQRRFRSMEDSRLMTGAGGTAALIGAGAVVLGILALLDISPIVLSLIAALVLGAGMVLSGSALAMKLGRLASR